MATDYIQNEQVRIKGLNGKDKPKVSWPLELTRHERFVDGHQDMFDILAQSTRKGAANENQI